MNRTNLPESKPVKNRRGKRSGVTHRSTTSLSGNMSRISKAMLVAAMLCSALLLSSGVKDAHASPGIGYWIIVEGATFPPPSSHYAIIYGCTQVYNILRGVGYPPERIMYLAAATNYTFEWAIEWAGGKVASGEPLWIYMFGHGDNYSFCFHGGTCICYNETDDLLDEYIPSGVNTNMIIAACHSGGAINELSRVGRVIITSCMENQNSSLYNPEGIPTWEAFSWPFWDQIKAYQTVKDAFNYACWVIKNQQNLSDQDPLLDDDGNLPGHTGALPHGGDGYVAASLHIGSHEYVYPSPSVGGVSVPVDKFGLSAPYVGLALATVVGTAVLVTYGKRDRRREEKGSDEHRLA